MRSWRVSAGNAGAFLSRNARIAETPLECAAVAVILIGILRLYAAILIGQKWKDA